MQVVSSARADFGGNVRDIEPEMRCGADGTEEAVQVYGLAQITVGMQLIGFANVAIGVRCSEHGDWYQPQQLVCFDEPKQLARIGLGQIEIEKNQLRRGSILILALALQELESFVALGRDVYDYRRFQITQHLAHQAHVCGIILHDQYVTVLWQIPV
jgi:hypothetical protein